MIIRIYGLFEAFLLRNDIAQLGERVPQSLSNDVMKLLGVRVPVIAHFYDPTTFLFEIFFYNNFIHFVPSKIVSLPLIQSAKI